MKVKFKSRQGTIDLSYFLLVTVKVSSKAIPLVSLSVWRSAFLKQFLKQAIEICKWMQNYATATILGLMSMKEGEEGMF